MHFSCQRLSRGTYKNVIEIRMQSLKLFCTQEDYGTHNAYIPNQNFITYVAEMEDIIA